MNCTRPCVGAAIFAGASGVDVMGWLLVLHALEWPGTGGWGNCAARCWLAARTVLLPRGVSLLPWLLVRLSCGDGGAAAGFTAAGLCGMREGDAVLAGSCLAFCRAGAVVEPADRILARGLRGLPFMGVCMDGICLVAGAAAAAVSGGGGRLVIPNSRIAAASAASLVGSSPRAEAC